MVVYLSPMVFEASNDELSLAVKHRRKEENMQTLDAIIATVDCRNNHMQASDAVKYCHVMPLSLACTKPHFLGRSLA
jgi:hypothetical protein